MGLVHALVLLAALVAVAPAQADSSLTTPADNQLRLRIEAFSYGTCALHGSDSWDGSYIYDWISMHVLSTRLEWQHLRLGVSYYQENHWLNCTSVAPVTIGYTLYQRPVPLFGRFAGMVPDVSAQVTAYWLNYQWADERSKTPFATRAEVCAGADMLGIGVSLSAGAAIAWTREEHWHSPTTSAFGATPFLELRGAFGTTSLNLSGSPRARAAAPPKAANTEPRRPPKWYGEVTLLSGGVDAVWHSSTWYTRKIWLWPSVSYLDIGARWKRLRVGVTGGETYGGFYAGSLLPVHIAYTIWERPSNYAGRLYGRTPEVYAQVTGHWAVWSDPPPYIQAVKAEVAAKVDRFGVGITAAAGVVVERSSTSGYGTDVSAIPFIGIRASLLTLSAGF